MRPEQFVIWLRGFSEACNDFHPTPKQWDRIKEVLEEVVDYEDDANLEFEPEDWYGITEDPFPPMVSPTNTQSTGSGGSMYTTAVWNDKMGCWHYTNYPDGFGYYPSPENKKQQLND